MDTAIPDSEQYPVASDRLNLPPQSVQAEQALLGGLMLDRSAWERVADLVNDSDFYRNDHHFEGYIDATRALYNKKTK